MTDQLAPGKTLRVVWIKVLLPATSLNNEETPVGSIVQVHSKELTAVHSVDMNEEVKQGTLAVAAVKACHPHAEVE